MAHDFALVHRQLVLPPDRRRRPEAPRGAVQIGVKTADLSQWRLGARRLGPRPDRHQLCLRLVRTDMVAPRLAASSAWPSASSRASRLRAKLRLALVLAATLLASFLLEALHGLIARSSRRLALLVPRSLLVHHGLPRDARKSRGGTLVDGDEPEDALVLQPRRAVDHRPEVEAGRPRIDRRAHAEAEQRALAGSSVRC